MLDVTSPITGWSGKNFGRPSIHNAPSSGPVIDPSSTADWPAQECGPMLCTRE